MAADPIALMKRKTGDWWQDDRRYWCAYCGVAIKGGAERSTGEPTRDHVIPKAHKGRHVTIPACRECNQKKGKTGLPEFLLTAYFSGVRQRRRPNQWHLRDLWLVMALAAVEQARTYSLNWPDAEKTDAPNTQGHNHAPKAAPGRAFD